MPRWILFALLPLFAAALVFGPTLLSVPDGARASSETAKSAPETPPRTASPLTTSLPSSLPSGLKIGASLAFVLAIALGGVWVVRRVQHPDLAAGGTRSIEIKESRRLGKGRAIHYLRVADHLLLIAESETGIHLIRDLTPRELEHDEAVDFLVDEDGATPRNLLPPAQRGATAPADTNRKRAKLGDFRELLGKLA